MIDQLFKPHHNENLLKPCADAVAKIRGEGTQVYAVSHFDGAQMMALNLTQDTSIAVNMADGDVIILNLAAVAHSSNIAGVSREKALEGVLWHEYSHLFLQRHGGNANSEAECWDMAATRSSLARDEMDRLRSFCQHGLKPAVRSEPEEIDFRPQWVRRFDELASHLGYADAWRGTQCYRTTLSADALFADLKKSGWGFDVAWAIAHEGNISDGLRQLAIERMDKTELMRNVIPLEQLNPDSSLPLGASLRF